MNTLKLLFVSYRNHVVYLSLYVYVTLSSIRKLQNHPYHNHAVAASPIQDSAMLSNGLSLWGWLWFHYAVVSFFLVCLYFEVRIVWNRRRMPPGDSGYPVVGHFFVIVKDFHSFIVRRVQSFGPMSTHHMWGQAGIILTKDEDVKWAMAQEREGATHVLSLPHWNELLGYESIFLQSGADHKRLRKIFEPAFAPNAIKDYSKSMDAVVRAQLRTWSASGDYQPPREWALLAMRVFFVCAFGDVDKEHIDRLARLFEGWVDGFRAVPFKLPGGRLQRAHRFKQEIFGIFREMINKFKAHNPPPEPGQPPYKSILGRLCYVVDNDGNMPTEKVLMDNLLFLLFAGFDTTKGSFGAIFHNLNEHPHALEALLEEVKGLDLAEDDPDVDQLKFRAPVLNAVLAETWRLAPPVANHTTTAKVDLYYKGYTIPKGTFLCMDLSAHNILNETRYKDPTEFCFERWLPEDHPLFDKARANSETIDYNVMSNKFRSFSMGQHMCLGGHFAKMETRIVVSRILQRYTVDVRNKKCETFPLFQILNEFKLTPNDA